MSSTNKIHYPNLVEDHRPAEDDKFNLFEKVLVVSNRAKDLQQLQSLQANDDESPCYKALWEYNEKKIIPKVVEKDIGGMAIKPLDEDE